MPSFAPPPAAPASAPPPAGVAPQPSAPPPGGPAPAAERPSTPFSPGGSRAAPNARPGGFLPGLAIGAAVGVAAGAGLAAVRERRREVDEGGRTFIQEPGRVIVREGDRAFIRHDEAERFQELGPSRTERRGRETVTIIQRPDGGEVITVVDDDGRLVRRIRRSREGREVVIIDNTFAGPPRPFYEEVVDLPPPPLTIPRDRYIVEADRAPPELIYETLAAPPLEPIRERYTLDQVRYSPNLRARMRSVDVDTINFDSGSWAVTPDQAGRLSTIAQAINRTLAQNPQEVFLIEGYTDAVGSDIDNLSLSDRRAQSAAELLTRVYRVPPENLTTQGYGEQYLKVNTQEAARENRRVTVRRITPLLDGQASR